MEQRSNKKHVQSVQFKASEIMLAVKMMDVLEKPLEMVYYLMEQNSSRQFVLLLMSAEHSNIQKVFKFEKRDTDILFEIDKEQSLYAILCQDTRVDGGYRFAERLIKKLFAEDAKDIYCAELEVRSTNYTIKQIIFKIIETFIQAKADEKKNHIIYKSLA